jgi:SH3 domain-containing YSC84-like protein 1
VSIAAGPVGRNAEAAGAASLKSVAGIFSYSKTKGLFAGVSLEGSEIIERRDANEKLYGRQWTAQELLSSQVPVPVAAEPLITGSRKKDAYPRLGTTYRARHSLVIARSGT